MKCCSLKMLDLECHFKRMLQRFYQLNGYNDPSLKNTYVSSLPEELQEEMYRMITVMQRDVASMTLREIHQTCLAALDKLYSQQVLLRTSSKIGRSTPKPTRKITLK